MGAGAIAVGGGASGSIAAAARRSATLVLAARVLPYVLASPVLLLPCYWQSRIQAGDLSSHIYNAWLAQLIENGSVQGLTIVRQTTNVLFDLILSGLFRWFGAESAQRAAVSVSVLVFVWGAFAFVHAVCGRRPWHVLPAIVMLAYGWVFHMGFLNFYLGLGMCFWALALIYDGGGKRAAAALPLLLLAYTAHALPVLWAVGLAVYIQIFRRLTPRRRGTLLAASLLLFLVVNLVVSRTLVSVWSANQISLATGADQVWVFDGKYFVLMAALFVVWGAFLIDVLRGRKGREVVAGLPFHLCVLAAAAVCMVPSSMLLPEYHHALVYIAERMSLAGGICICGLLATGQPAKLHRFALTGLALVYFVFLFRDERALNGFEDRMQAVVAQLPAGERVVSPIIGPGLRANALTHMVDRVCLGRCFSYANYEPSTAQFRIRVVRENPYVVARYGDSWDLQNGKHVIQPGEAPMVAIEVGKSGELEVRHLKAGVLCESTSWRVL